MTGAGDLAGLESDLAGMFDKLEPVHHAMGAAGKAAALEQAARDLGGDLAMSGMKKRAKISAGYDLDDRGVTLNMRPVGLVILAHGGRTRSKKIVPAKRGGARALRIGSTGEVRASSMSLPSRGLDTISKTIKRCATDVPKATDKAVAELITKVL